MIYAINKILTGLLLLFFSAVIAAENNEHHYSVTVDEALTRLEVKACFAGDPPAHLERLSESEHTQASILYARLGPDKHSKSLLRRSNKLSLAGMQAGDCVYYAVGLDKGITHPRFKSRQSTREQVLLDIHSWLFLPETMDEAVNAIRVSFHLPSGLNVSTPWQQIPSVDKAVSYHIRQHSVNWKGRIAIGRFFTEQRRFGHALVNIAVLNAKGPMDLKSIRQWVHESLQAVSDSFQGLPVPQLQLLVVPVGNNNEVVPWGQTMRGGGEAVHIYIDETRSLQAFLGDWVLVHELSHLLHPGVTVGGNWLVEGLASYYQNVLRARAGLLSAQEAWQELHEGFMRGKKSSQTPLTLLEASKQMHDNKGYMRVYWSGAAISLLADYQLRKRSNGRQSLDDVLKGFAECCLPSDRLWEASEIMSQLDEISDTEIFSDLYKRYIDSIEFPELSQLYQDLGIGITSNRVSLNNTAPAEAIRTSIMEP